MQAPAPEMPGSNSVQKNILLAIVELGYWHGSEGADFSAITYGLLRVEFAILVCSGMRVEETR